MNDVTNDVTNDVANDVTNDVTFMWRMLGYAASNGDDERTPDDLRADPALGRYLDGWGRTGDVGVVAVDGDDARIGAAWIRLFSADCPGYGYIDEGTPELTIACLASFRGIGVGRALIEAVLDRARRAGFARVGLSVAYRNERAKALYAGCGFRPVHATGDLSVDAAPDGGSITLVASTGRAAPDL